MTETEPVSESLYFCKQIEVTYGPQHVYRL